MNVRGKLANESRRVLDASWTLFLYHPSSFNLVAMSFQTVLPQACKNKSPTRLKKGEVKKEKKQLLFARTVAQWGCAGMYLLKNLPTLLGC